ncbi:hypothetical protein [Streptomyces rishiriensis]|uniref:Uncharacterized protein n=1 Tax=Streptomyces rishiriensis TaxID=68264 RepID=A0ABU0NNH0_STRRH|nr:hypothetical protein [Streptomyces rishiriensis]MDQ0580639.1 hypothetical protein [Streptomyces rishiriensis]
MRHDPGLAAACAHPAVIPCAGQAAADGPPGEVFTGRPLPQVGDQPVRGAAAAEDGRRAETQKRNL